MGYSSLYILINFGTLWITLTGLPVFFLIIYGLMRISQKCPILQQWILNKIFFDYTIKFVNEAFFIICVGIALNTFYYKWNTFANVINSIPCTLGVFIIVSHIVILVIIFSKKRYLELILSSDKRFEAKFGSMFKNINIKTGDLGLKALHFNLLCNLRKVVFVVTVIYL
jgi:hypothetical protein